jgi:hypothetical protein
MKYQVLEAFRVRTSRSEMEIQPRQIITLSHDKAIGLLNQGKITPVEKVAYRIYSEILETFLWVVETDRDMHTLRSQGKTEAIYTQDEIAELNGLCKDSLREIHRTKEVFPKSTIEQVKSKDEEL